jgi:transposase
VLAELRRFLGGEKATLLWDGLPAHRSRAMQAWLHTQRHWLVVERLPAYAPELNPVEGLWSWLKAPSSPTSSARLCGRWSSRPSWHRTRPADATSWLLVPSPDWALGLKTRQANTQDPLVEFRGLG